MRPPARSCPAGRARSAPPPAGVLVLPASVEGDAVAAFEGLYARSGSLPPLMGAGVMEPRIPRHYVLLHDAAAAPPGGLARAQERHRTLAAALGPSVGQQVHLVVINSRGPEQPAGMDPRFWAAALPGVWRALCAAGWALC